MANAAFVLLVVGVHLEGRRSQRKSARRKKVCVPGVGVTPGSSDA